MLTSKNLLAGLGAFAGLGIALMPLASVSATDPEGTGTGLVRAQVGEKISVAVATNYTEFFDESTDQADGFVSVAAGGINENLVHTVTVTGNTYNDYSLTMAGLNGSTDLLRVVDDTQDVGTSARYSSDVKIATGTTIEANASTSAWAFKKQGHGENAYSASYMAIPSAHDAANATIHAAATTGDDAHHTTTYTEDSLVKFGIAASATQMSGIYEGQVEYIATATSAL